MAVDFDLLVTGLNIQEVLVDKMKTIDISQSASGARIFFYKPNKIDLKNVYILTGDPQNPFTVAQNPLTLNTAGAAEQKLYYYFFDEDVDNPTSDDEELYYIQVLEPSPSNVVIYEVGEFVRNPPTSGGGTSTSSNVNLAPDYGFNVLIRPEYYAQSTAFYLENIATHPALGYVWYVSDPAVGQFSYSFTKPSIGDLPGDPLHYINLVQENFSSSQTNLWFGFPICQAPELVGTTVTFQFLWIT